MTTDPAISEPAPSTAGERAEYFPLSAIRAIAVEAIRAVTGCPDIKGNGKYLVDEIEDVAKHAALLQSTPDARPVGELTTCNCRWNGEEQVQSCTLHAAHVDAIHEWAERAKTAERELAAARTQPERVPNHTEQANAAHAAAANHTREIVKLVNAARNGITGGEQ